MEVSKRETTNSEITSELSGPQQSRAELSEEIQSRLNALGMNWNAFVMCTGLSPSDLSSVLDGEENEITTEHLQAALETLNLSDDVWVINNIMMGVGPPVTPRKVEDLPRPSKAEDLPRPSIGEMIRRRRVELDLAQVEVARRIGVSGVLVSQWEMGKSRIMADDLPKIAAALSTTSSRLMGELPTDTKDAYQTLKRTLADLSARMSLDQLGDLCASAAKILGRS